MTKSPFNLRQFARLTAAVHWACRAEEDPHLGNTPELHAWLQKSGNRTAFNRVRQTWKLIDDYKSAPELLTLRRKALKCMPPVSPVHRFDLGFAWISIVAVTLAVGLFTVGFIILTNNSSAVYSTGVGQRRIVVLDDNSRIWLDASSMVVVNRYSKYIRQLSLKKGRARFDVAPDKARPFSVVSGPTTTVAVGTSFDVERLGRKILVTVRRGHVLVKNTRTGLKTAKAIKLAPNQQLVANPNGQPTIRSVNIKERDAWQRGKLIFDDQNLREAVEQFNRYLYKPILVDTAIANIRISGVFNAGDSHAFIDAITNYFPVQAQLAANDQTLLVRKPPEQTKKFARDR